MRGRGKRKEAQHQGHEEDEGKGKEELGQGGAKNGIASLRRQDCAAVRARNDRGVGLRVARDGTKAGIER
jgi:hypothetical protein